MHNPIEYAAGLTTAAQDDPDEAPLPRGVWAAVGAMITVWLALFLIVGAGVMSAWVLVLVFAFLNAGATTVTIDMADYQTCATAKRDAESADAMRALQDQGARSLKFATCLEREP